MTPTPMADADGTFTCDLCHRTFEREWSEAEANAEAERLWGVRDACQQPRMSVVCDVCFTRVLDALSKGDAEP